MSYPIPILFIIYNRKQIAKHSFESIRLIQPKHLFIACDGPKTDSDRILITEVREEITQMIDWDCDCKTLFQDSNLGCGIGVYTAIQWFFSVVEMGIILEDDCIANVSFFAFQQEMLLKYKDDDRIGMVAGTNPIRFSKYKYSYLFSKYKSCWGWATWRRAWNNMDINMTWRDEGLHSVLLNSGFCGKDISGWKYKLRCIDNNTVSAWDWQWYFSLAAQNQLCIYPVVNMVSNIGNDEQATHTSLGNITLQTYSLAFPLVHPKHVLPDSVFDESFYRDMNSFRIRLLRLIPKKVKQFIKKRLIGFIKK